MCCAAAVFLMKQEAGSLRRESGLGQGQMRLMYVPNSHLSVWRKWLPRDN